ncbi:hypothetical protein E2C01_005010 [Portunus trituberculatus]|uniref:Uncharacterized protein n=1 Tax=Portunus trituberculatus TaxID=210409 RepID=A0A5B7CSV7_PORTR|nr:hypothetical protein [Portunus trituberculatus]
MLFLKKLLIGVVLEWIKPVTDDPSFIGALMTHEFRQLNQFTQGKEALEATQCCHAGTNYLLL